MKYSLFSLLPAVILLLGSPSYTSALDLKSEYSFSATLHDNYELYWSYDLAAETIQFAVRVRTEGWVGFGLSPNGQMPGSDVIIGWVDDQGKVVFHDRFAERRALPAVDESQDWILEFGKEESGYTILGFRRSITTCDPKDLDIFIDTSRVVWSWHSSDPVNADSVMRHEFRGSTSINLLGGLSNPPPPPPDADSFIIAMNNVTIPSDKDTTYWCHALRLPPEIRETKRYIFEIAAKITEGNTAYVHHMLIYLCSELNHTLVGQSAECDSAHVEIQECRGGHLIGAWAVGGSTFQFPEDVALPVGGPGAREYIVIEMHYDNPKLHSDVVDASGLEFFYSNTEPVHEAGVLFIGYNVLPSMIIPPKTDNYLIEAFCSGQCTEKHFPPDGITVFGNGLHTHIYGHGLRVQHFRWNKECNVTEELRSIDKNFHYDFNYQQLTHLPETVKVMPGDSILLQCFYRTTNTASPVLGGESTRDEMCLSFLYYYPRVDLSFCTSSAHPPFSFTSFAKSYIDESNRNTLLTGLANQNATEFFPILDAVDWTPEAVQSFKDSVLNTPQIYFCSGDEAEESLVYGVESLPRSECPYEAPDKCSGFQPQSCCERVQSATEGNGTITPTSVTEESGVTTATSLSSSLVIALISLYALC